MVDKRRKVANCIEFQYAERNLDCTKGITKKDSRYLVSPTPRRADSDDDDTDEIDSDDEAPRRSRRNSAFKRAVRKIVTAKRNEHDDAAAPARRPQMSTGLTVSFAAKIQVREEETRRPLKRKVSSTNDATVAPLRKRATSTRDTRTVMTRRTSTARKRHIEDDDDDDDDDDDHDYPQYRMKKRASRRRS